MPGMDYIQRNALGIAGHGCGHAYLWYASTTAAIPHSSVPIGGGGTVTAAAAAAHEQLPAFYRHGDSPLVQCFVLLAGFGFWYGFFNGALVNAPRIQVLALSTVNSAVLTMVVPKAFGFTYVQTVLLIVVPCYE